MVHYVAVYLLAIRWMHFKTPCLVIIDSFILLLKWLSHSLDIIKMLRVPLFLYTGLKNFTKEGYLKAARSFDQQYMVQESSLLGKTCMVTGANQGLGLQVSIELASRGGSLYMVCRNEAKGREAVERVKRVSKNDNVHLLICDISSLKDVEKLCNQYIQSGRPLHVLVRIEAYVAMSWEDTVSVFLHVYCCADKQCRRAYSRWIKICRWL